MKENEKYLFCISDAPKMTETEKKLRVLEEVCLGGGGKNDDGERNEENGIKLLGMTFAPIRIPLERRLQTLGVAMFFFLFLLFSVFCAVLMIYMLFWTRLWWISVLYASWIYYDREIGE